MKFRYFITDNTNCDSLIVGSLNPQTMLLLLGMVCKKQSDKSEVVDFFVQEFQFLIEAKEIDFVKLNTDKKYLYTYYNLIDEYVADDEDGYFYTNVDAFAEHDKETPSVEHE